MLCHSAWAHRAHEKSSARYNSPFSITFTSKALGTVDMADSSSGQIDHVLTEDRLFPPPAEFTKQAVFSSQKQYEDAYAAARDNRDEFWKAEALEHLHWFEPFNEVCQWEAPDAKWFVGGKTNASYNCLDRHVQAGQGDKMAIIWEGEPGDTRTLTYAQLLKEVCKCAEGLQSLGIGQGDVVSVYMPMTPELAIIMLACARIGAIHSVIFEHNIRCFTDFDAMKW